MQATGAAPQQPRLAKRQDMTRKIGWFLAVPVTVVVLLSITLALVVLTYQFAHRERIFTGVTVWGIDFSGLSRSQAERAINNAFPHAVDDAIIAVDPLTGDEWNYSLAEMGISFDQNATVNAAFLVGRQGGVFDRLWQQFSAWYYGYQIPPVLVFDESKLDQTVTQMASEINSPATDASLDFDGQNVGFALSKTGRSLDMADTRERLIASIDGLNLVRLQLLIHETSPRIDDASGAAAEIRQIMDGPMTLYLEEPLTGVDLEPVIVPVDELAKWIRVHTTEEEPGKVTTQVILDENALRAYLRPYQDILERDPMNARFYFDDATGELVLVEPHVNGRSLNIDATVDLFLEQVKTSNRSMPFVLEEIVPVVNSDATAAELGITELVSESTTWFYGSSEERMHNIARAAANFYGIVIAPGEEFSFNKYLGEVSAEQGYEQGLIIFGGRTIEGVGGGVCQVSTTAFQAAFWAGFPITERWEHGYQVGYYDDGEGPGMDATVYAPLVDFRFINDTPYHLLIENYYSEANSSLTFKFYSTSLGREILKEGPEITNVVPAKADVWEYNDDLEEGEIKQVDWAVEGADVSVSRTVYNANGDLLRQDNFASHYIPWQNIYQYGPGVELPTPEPTITPETTES